MIARRGWPAIPRLSVLRLSVLCLSVLGWASIAHAHLMSSGHGTLNVVKGKAYIVISLPIAAFGKSGAAIAVQDGVLTAAELKTHDKTLRTVIREGLTVQAGSKAVRFSSILLNLPQGDGHAPGQATDLVMMIVAPLGVEAKTVRVSSTLWAKGAEALKLKATVTEGQRTVQTEVHDLTAQSPAHRFFAKPASKPRNHGRSTPHSH